jgi:hypothetical protein
MSSDDAATDLALLAKYYRDPDSLLFFDQVDGRWLLLEALTLAGVCVRRPLIRNHVLQGLWTDLRMFLWTVTTCGVGFVVWWRSWNQWHLDARLAARAGRPVRPW